MEYEEATYLAHSFQKHLLKTHSIFEAMYVYSGY